MGFVPLLFALLSQASASPSLHVAPTGSDVVGTGAPSRPFATLARALRAVSPRQGATILLRGGTYPSTRAVVRYRGAAPLVIRAASGETPVLDGGGTAGAGWEGEDKARIPAVVDLRESRNVTVEGLEVANSPGFGISVWDSESVTVRRCRVHHTWSRGLGGSGAHLLFEDNEIFDAVLQNEGGRSAGAWSAAAATWYRPGGAPSRDVTWHGNRIHDSWGEGLIALHVDGARLVRNEVYDTYSGLIYIDHSRDVTVDSNRVYHTDKTRVTRRGGADLTPGIMFAAESYSGTAPMPLEKIRIVRNLIMRVQVGIGFWRDPSNTDPSNRYEHVTITDNRIEDAKVASIQIRAVSGGGARSNVLARNEIRDAGLGLSSAIRLGNPELWKVEN